MTWTATFPISYPARRTRAAVSASSATPEAPAHSGSAVPKLRAEVAEARRGQQRVAHRVRADVAVGVALEALRLVGPGEAGEVHRYAVGEAVDVGADARSHSVRTSGHGVIMPEQQSTRADACAVGAGRACWPASAASPRRTSPPPGSGLRGNPVTDVAELVIRLTPGTGGRGR